MSCVKSLPETELAGDSPSFAMGFGHSSSNCVSL